MDPCGTAVKETFQSDNDLFPAAFPSRVFQVDEHLFYSSFHIFH